AGVALAQARVRNPAGCAACAGAGLPALRGYAGRTVVAELLEPETDAVLLDLIRRRDNPALRRLLGRRARRQPPDAPLRAVDCAWRKVEAGVVDPRLVERCFALPPALRTPVGAEDGHG
ncbi:general secretion pathway protein, partial [Bordetella bronchiseptica]